MLKDLKDLRYLLRPKQYLKLLEKIKNDDVDEVNTYLKEAIKDYETLSAHMSDYGYNLLQSKVNVCRINVVKHLKERYVRRAKVIIQPNK